MPDKRSRPRPRRSLYHPRLSAGLLILAIIAGVNALQGCGGEAGGARPTPQMLSLGREVYNRPNGCASCHQPEGEGKYMEFPPMWGNPHIVEEDPTRLIKTVSHGMVGKLTVAGRTIDSAMPGWHALLTDEEIAAVLTYVRNSWGNEASAVSPEQVAAIKTEFADRQGPWTVTELETGVAAGPLEIAFDENEDPIALGRKVYMSEGMCGSCHQPEGQGIAGSYPPLAGSDWVSGDRERLIKIALHGMSGTIERKGVQYSNEMPAQGGLMDDRLMAAVLTYLRSAWGNTGDAILPEHVALMRERYASIDHPWPAEELAAQDRKSPLKNLRYTVVACDPEWKRFPDISKLEPIATGTLNDNFIRMELPGDVPTVDLENGGYAIIYEADLEVTTADTYQFALEAINAAALYINDEPVINLQRVQKWIARGSEKIDLPVGTHKLRLHFTQIFDRGVLSLSWLAPSLNRELASMTPTTTNALRISDPDLLLAAKPERAIVHRGRYERQSPGGVGIGYSERVNLAYDVKRMQWNMLWLEDFVNAGYHWSGREQLYAIPAGNDILRLTLQPPLAELSSADADWPADAGMINSPAGYRFKGYALNQRGEPTFRYTVNGMDITDEPKPVQRDNTADMQRTIVARTQANQAAPDTLYHLIAAGESITEQNGGYVVDGLYRVTLPESVAVTLRRQGNTRQLIAPAVFKADGDRQVAKWKYTFSWLSE